MPIQKNGGLSYMEVVIALALFCVMTIPLFPGLMQARKNANYARQTYQAQLAANQLAQTLKGTLARGEDPQPAADACATGSGFACAFWVTDMDGVVLHSYATEDAPEWEADTGHTGPGLIGIEDGRIIIAAVWSGEGRAPSVASLISYES